ncbi:hypothetical protein SAMN04488522_102554 [Pedobacter caeni]|uniref:Uncharacterized protein n=2 Tax=Pedobacter caeni TaxID=288992 RepID=A0A1M5A1X7_9SPHI|nr:hypothetical protein SAMN04488522_102554 [Pedobacter caeni]
MYLIIIAVILLIALVPLLVNRIYSARLDKSYRDLTDFSKADGYTLKKVSIKGKLQFQHTDSSADYVSFIYMDTVNLNFKVITKIYTGVGDHYETAYVTFDQTGKIIETDRYIPFETETTYQFDRETLDAEGKVIRRVKDVETDSINNVKNCVLLNGLLPPWPKWKEKSSPVYIRHFAKKELNWSELNPFQLAGINGSGNVSVWSGFAYCDLQFMGKTVKLKIPFGYDSLFFNTNDYYADLQYYTLPEEFMKKLPVRFIQLKNDIYVLSSF